MAKKTMEGNPAISKTLFQKVSNPFTLLLQTLSVCPFVPIVFRISHTDKPSWLKLHHVCNRQKITRL